MVPARTFISGLACIAGLAWGGPLYAEVLKVATYNIENYGPAGRMTESGYRPDYPKPEAEKRALRSVIRAIDADVLALQEMGGAAHLEELQSDLRREGTDYPFAALASGADADRHVALLSRRRLTKILTHDHLEFSYFGKKELVKRGMLEATVAVGSGDVTLFVVHLKSRITDRPDDPRSEVRRAGEARAVRDAILARFPNPSASRFVLLGDCNDSRGSKSVHGLQFFGKNEIAILLPAMDSRGETWTHYYRREETYSCVDLILVSPALRRCVEGGRSTVFDGEGVAAASDHRPVLVTIGEPAKK